MLRRRRLRAGIAPIACRWDRRTPKAAADTEGRAHLTHDERLTAMALGVRRFSPPAPSGFTAGATGRPSQQNDPPCGGRAASHADRPTAEGRQPKRSALRQEGEAHAVARITGPDDGTCVSPC
ncbi:hypothetical protein BN12_880001 [Nostocoides japonicum T1-X7]|uniref:Uncharacterized protein n=1 Tax=Nostocoides japonicum T1-X7 TaxID=1194083 RepID=A0A077M1W5_9MICO|nr:hypothetical protein BN12_880001 [Tetrasphaera japonica T1-X7]